MTKHTTSHPIVGVWRLVAHETVFDDGSTINLFGADPCGRLILTDSGHMMGFVSGPRRRPGESDPERAALHRSMIAYSGTYRIAGDRFIVAVDLSWHQAWNGTEQSRTFRLDAGQLHIVSAAGPSPFLSGRTSHGRLLWEREAAAIP